MSERGNPYENAMAESMNSIIKLEYLNDEDLTSHAQAYTIVAQAIHKYNCKRPHGSLNYRKPIEVHMNANMRTCQPISG